MGDNVYPLRGWVIEQTGGPVSATDVFEATTAERAAAPDTFRMVPLRGDQAGCISATGS